MFFLNINLEYVEYTDGTISPATRVNANINANINLNANANTQQVVRTASPVQRTPGRIADYDPLTETRPSPYSGARQGATTVIYTSDKGAGNLLVIYRYLVYHFISLNQKTNTVSKFHNSKLQTTNKYEL